MPRLPRFARADVRAYNKEIREKRIIERDFRETLERMVATLRHLGYPAEISLTVPTVCNWEIELESEASDLEDSDSDSDSPESVYTQAARSIGKKHRKEERKAAYQERLEARTAAIIAAVFSF